jgi:hypothetical protein
MCEVKLQTTIAAAIGSRRLCACFIGLCLTPGAAFQAHGQDPAIVPDSSVESKPADDTLSLTGTVVNSLTGEPIRGAVVTIFSTQTNFSVLSDSSGHFQLDGLTEGRAFITATKPGFGNPLRAPFQRTTVQVSRGVSPVLLKMNPTGAIVGRLTSRDDLPLENFQLRLISKQSVGGKQRWAYCPFQAATDDNGNFRIAGLPADTYYLQVAQSQETTLSQRGIPNAREQSYAEAFYPGVSDLTAATPIELTGGREVDANFSITAEPLHEVSGIVSTQENLAFPIVFSRKAGEGYDFVQNVIAQEGRFQIKLPAGSYNVTGSVGTGIQATAFGVVVSSDSPNLNIALSAAAPIRVEVQKESVSGTVQPDVPEQPGTIGLNLQLVPTSGLQQATYWWSPGPWNGLQNVEPGVYAVQVNIAPGTWYLKSLRSGGVDLLSDDLTVADGTQPQPIEITLRDDAAIVRGTVRPADAMTPATVLLVQPHGKRNLIKVGAAFQGKFEIDSVAPGDYSVLAFDAADRLEYENPDVMNPYLSRAEHVSLQPHGTANVNLSLSSTGR